MRLLLMADVNSIHTFLSVKELFMPAFSLITIFNIRQITNDEHLKFYEDNNVEVINAPYDNSSFIKKGISFLKVLHALKKVGRYDVCILMYLDRFSCSILKQRVSQFNKIFCIYMGSDLLRSNAKLIQTQKKLLAKSDYVSPGETYMQEIFKEKFDDEFNDKIVRFDFIVLLDKNIEVIKDRCTICNELGLDSSKIIVQIGYNASIAHNHLKIIEQVKNVGENYLNRCQFVFMLTYGASKQQVQAYKKRIIEYCNLYNLNYVVKEEFLSKTQMLEMASVVDIFLHFIDTDSFSGSMLELLLGGAYMIKGAWLKYYELDRCVMSSCRFDELSGVLMNTIDNLSSLKNSLVKNKEIIYEVADKTIAIDRMNKIMQKLQQE